MTKLIFRTIIVNLVIRKTGLLQKVQMYQNSQIKSQRSRNPHDQNNTNNNNYFRTKSILVKLDKKTSQKESKLSRAFLAQSNYQLSNQYQAVRTILTSKSIEMFRLSKIFRSKSTFRFTLSRIQNYPNPIFQINQNQNCKPQPNLLWSNYPTIFPISDRSRSKTSPNKSSSKLLNFRNQISRARIYFPL